MRADEVPRMHAAVEPAVYELNVGVVHEVGPARPLPVGTLDGQACCGLRIFSVKIRKNHVPTLLR